MHTLLNFERDITLQATVGRILFPAESPVSDNTNVKAPALQKLKIAADIMHAEDI